MSDKKRLLLISHCVPSPIGGADRARAWQLLKILSRDHRVNLACVFDGPVNLTQWSQVRALTSQLTVETTHRIRRAASRCLSHVHPHTANRLELGQPLGRTVRGWVDQNPFEVVVCTHPSVWPSLHGVYAQRKLLDLRSCGLITNRPFTVSSTTASLPPARSKEAEAEADLLIQNDLEESGQRLEVVQRRVQLPDAVDIGQITTLHGTAGQNVRPGHKQRVVYHADWRHPRARHLYNRFARLIWPEVRRMIPYAELAPSNAVMPGEGLASIADASLVVNTEPEPSLACLPILQAMTLRRTVVASEQAAVVLGAQQGEHLMRAGCEIDWVMQCVTVLSNARLRKSISENARRFVERYRQVEVTGTQLLQALRVGRTETPSVLARAA